ncbi:MAG: hypothetical protein KTR13_04625 [Saprospiraceae bacterium]|nr:hypothetical protein [Saprospiraceae bacterium]
MAQINEKKYFLNATEQDLAPNYPSLDDIVLKAVSCNARSFEFIDISNSVPSSTQYIQTKGTIRHDGSISGTFELNSNGYFAQNDRRNYKIEKTDIFDKRLKDSSLEHELTEITQTEKVKKSGTSFNFDCGFTIEDGTTSAGNRIYFSPILFSPLNSNPFTAESRKFRIDFAFPYKQIYLYEYEIPLGYSVEEIPESLSMRLSNGDITATVGFEQNENIISVRQQFQIKKTTFNKENYESIRELFDEYINAVNAEIVLKEVSN